MTIPLAVSPSVLTPGLYMTVDLLAGTASPGSGVLRVALLASKSSAGDLTDDTEVRSGAGEASAATAFGAGTVGHLAAKLVYQEYAPAQVDFISPVPGSGTATLDVTAAGAPTSNQVTDWDVMGRTFEVTWLVGESADDFRDKAIAAITSRANDLAVTASSGGAGVVTVDSTVDGNIGNDVLVKAKLRLAQTGTETLTGAVTLTNLASGSSDPDLTNALAAIAGREYHIVLPCLSNADVEQVVSDNNIKRTLDHINGLNTGLGAKLQQIVVGYSGAIATAKATALDANGCNNDGVAQLILCVNGRGLPGELGARETGGRIAAESLDPAANRIGELMGGYVGSADTIADTATQPESEDALGNGVSLVSYTVGGAAILVRPVTCHHQDTVGGADRRLLDVQNVSAAYIVARDVRDNLPLAFPQAKISPDIEEGSEPPPEGVVEERDVKAWVINRLRAWERKAVVTRASLDAAIADGSLIVQVNSSDATQVDIVMPFKVVQPWAKTGVVAQRQPS